MKARNVAPIRIMKDTSAFAVVGQVSILITNVPAWSTAIVDALYDDIIALTEPMPHTLMRHLGAEPDAAARKRLSERQTELEQRFPVRGERRLAVLTDSSMTRGAITAWRWLTSQEIAGFACRDVDKACEHLLGPRGDVAPILAAYRECVELARVGGAKPGAKTG